MSHTPGPWEIGFRNDYHQSVTSGTTPIVSLPNAQEYRGAPCGSVYSQGKTQEEIDANACLIAAAPDLLQSCKKAEQLYKDSIEAIGPCDHQVNICVCGLESELINLQEAIAKAVGKTTEGTEGHDRKSYSDDQDRENYTGNTCNQCGCEIDHDGDFCSDGCACEFYLAKNEEKICEWDYKPRKHGYVWQSGCAQDFDQSTDAFDMAGPLDIGWEYCPYCGAKIRIAQD